MNGVQAGVVALIAGLALAGCQQRPSAPPATSERVVHLVAPSEDASCLKRSGGTSVAEGLSDDDVAAIEALIRAKKDAYPIMGIYRLEPVSTRRNPTGAPFQAATGVKCHGALTGHGNEYFLQKTDAGWSITREGWWEG